MEDGLEELGEENPSQPLVIICCNLAVVVRRACIASVKWIVWGGMHILSALW